jgi:PQQ-dependent catabolism-associated beta-propeller protein
MTLPLAVLLAARVFVTSERAGTLTMIDGATVKTIAVGTRPRGIVLSPDGKRLYVAISHFRGQPSKTPDGVVAIDPSTLKIVRRYKAGTDPEGIAMAPDGKRFCVANEDAGTASIVDVASGKNIALVTGTEPEGVAASYDDRLFYVTAETSNTVTVIERSAVVANIFVDARPRAAVFARDGVRAYVSSEVGGSVNVIDVKSNRAVAHIKLRLIDHPVGVVLSPDGKRLYVATGRGNAVAVIDTATNGVLQYIAVGNRPWGIALTRDGRTLYTANGLSNDVSVIDTASGRVTSTIKVPDGPWGIAITP